jgi:prepilin-type processing-associated H-X9-DG protein
MIMVETEGIKRMHKTKRWLIIAAGVLILVVLSDIFVKSIAIVHGGKGHNQILCGSHLSSLGKQLVIYAAYHNNLYPDANKWCDKLMEDEYFPKNDLLCPNDKIGSCSYALNPNCKFDSPNDVVLIFESKPGWNQYGGPELMYPNNHTTKGCNICFNDGHVQFVEPKDFNSLKWK